MIGMNPMKNIRKLSDWDWTNIPVMRQRIPMMMVFFCPIRSMSAPLKKVTAMPARDTLVIMEEMTVFETEKSSLNIGMKIPLVFSINGDRNISVKMMNTPNLLLLLFCMVNMLLLYCVSLSISLNYIYIIISHWDII